MHTRMLTSVCLASIIGSVACRDLIGNAALPPGTQGPNTYNTPAGALAMYQATKSQSEATVFPAMVLAGGALTDELISATVGMSLSSIGATGDPVDERLIPESQTTAKENGTASVVYSTLQRLRGDARESRGLLQHYAPATSPALQGEMYALEGYADLFLAELFCSGVPLSTLDFEKDFTYRPSATTSDVTQQAVALFDSALTISSDSASIMSLASVGKGRALLDLGDYAGAAHAVSTVPVSFQYVIPVLWTSSSDEIAFQGLSVANYEGGTGLPFSSANDPRVVVDSVGANPFGVALYTPAKYGASNTTTSFVLASGIEAQLIQAEAALHADPNDPSWLNILNAVRTTCTDATSCPSPASAGTGGVAGLPPLSDPGQVAGSDSARVTLLFTERAYWLFLTGERQGDLRRLVRNYGRRQDAVYPTGPYYGGLGAYGSDVNLPIPAEERSNPFFHGCLGRGA